jgi:hypothetical protein
MEGEVESNSVKSIKDSVQVSLPPKSSVSSNNEQNEKRMLAEFQRGLKKDSKEGSRSS